MYGKTISKIAIILFITIVLSLVPGIYVSSWSEEEDVATRVESLPFPRLCKMNWYSPLEFRKEYNDHQGIEIGLDQDHTALMETLRIYDLVIYGGKGFKDSRVAEKFAYLKEELNPNMVLSAQWSPSGNGLNTLDYSLYGEYPFRPEWFSMLVGSTLASSVSAGATTITIQREDADKFYQISPSGNPWNDNIFIEDLEDRTKSEMILLRGRDDTTLYLHPQANYENYDYSQLKFDHSEGARVWIGHSPNWHAWWGYNLSTECPRSDTDGLKWVEYYSDYVWDTFSEIQFFEDKPLVDIIHLDAFEELYYGPFNSYDFVEANADFNLDAIPDIEQHSPEYIDWANGAWGQGHVDFAQILRQKATDAGQPTVPITQLGWGDTQLYINGQLMENLPLLEDDDELSENRWLVALSRYETWMNDTSGPELKICMAEGGYVLEDMDNYQLMRKSLTFILMGDGYFAFDGGEDWHGYTFWWYDEYAVNSSGRAVVHNDGSPITSVDPTQMDEDTYQRLKAGKGYLGMPSSDGYNLGGEDILHPRYGILWRSFEGGVVLCSLQDEDVVVPIDPAERLVRIKGVQDSVVNNGQPVGDSIILPAHDGIILLRQEKFNHAPELNGIEDKIISENELLGFVISATDSDDDTLTLTGEDLPENAVFTDNGDNTAIFSWAPTFEQAGEYYISFTADDNKGGITVDTVKITVIDVDITPPVISNIEAGNIMYNSAGISWATDELADSKVEFGLDTNYTNTIEDSQLVIEHQLKLEGLEYLTTYHYRVISKDARGNETTSPDYTFTTAMPIISGDLTSDFDYVVVGQDITLYATVTNESDVNVETNLWLDDILPDGSDNPRNPINQEIKAIVLAPQETQNFVFVISCPKEEPLGLHTTTLKVGPSDELLFAADSIEVDVNAERTRKKKARFITD